MGRQRIKFYTEKGSFWVEGASILMGLAIVFRLIGCWGFWGWEMQEALWKVALPVGAGLLFILLLVLLGKHALWTTSLPVLLGVAFFIIKAFTFESKIQTVLCVLLYVLVAILYVGTVFTLIRTKWLLVPLFGLPFLYHVFVEDLRAMQDMANPPSFPAGMQEMSVLCIMLALFFTACGMKKLVKEPKKPKKAVEEPAAQPAAQPVEPVAAESAPAAEEPAPELAAPEAEAESAPAFAAPEAPESPEPEAPETPADEKETDA